MDDHSNLSNLISGRHSTGSLNIDNGIFSLHVTNITTSVFIFLSSFGLFGCLEGPQNTFNTDNFQAEEYEYEDKEIIVGAERTNVYYEYLKNKKVGVVVNQTSRVGDHHLVDTLLSLGIQIVKIFTPEHGYRGTADAGEKIEDDRSADIPIVSLYGNNKKPSQTDIQDLDIILFDIQDVGARFYTYISTLHYVMEAAAESDKQVIVLDRPNPNGFYVDGPILNPAFSSFVGMHPVPIVHGMTIGEYAKMINGEKWLANGAQCYLKVIPCTAYDHSMTYDLPIKPSPNLPNLKSILLYPSLCLFEGTTVSVGRGTNLQFQLTGHPALKDQMPYSFTPVSKAGAKYPKHENVPCYGMEFHHADVSTLKADKALNINLLIRYYQLLKAQKEPFFLDNGFFDKLAGGDQLRKKIESGSTAEEIRKSWQSGLDDFKKMRSQYLIYP